MQVIIAEKPSVAREIAAIVGATNRKDLASACCGVHRPLHGEIRRQGEGGSSPRRGYRRPNGTRRERGAQGDQGTAASLCTT